MKRWLPLVAAVATVFSIGPAGVRAGEKADGAKAAAGKEKGYVSLWNGKDLSEWKVGKNADTFSVQDGQIVVHGNGPAHLFYEGPVHHHDFKNFHLKAEVMTFPHANSGIYFHTKYQEEGWPAQGFEAQVNQTHADPKKTGGLYAVKDVMNVPPAEDGKWFLYEIIVKDKHVVLKVDGKVTTDWTEPTPPAPPEGMPGRVIGHGTIALQGHDPGSEVHYKNIRIKVLPD
jgi:hypothetical protein